MLSPEGRFGEYGALLFVEGPNVYYIVDWDQRRWYSVSGSYKALRTADDAIRDLARHIDQLGPDVCAITVSDAGELVSVSTDPDDDVTLALHYAHLSEPLDATETRTRSQLVEVDRVFPATDLVSLIDGADTRESPSERKVYVFKYAMVLQSQPFNWDELHILKAVSGHPSIVPFGHIILDEVDSTVLGFTTAYIPGGTLEENRSRPFQLAWLQQLTALVDDLNLRFGLQHQDITARNLAIDPVTNRLQLLGCRRASKLGSPKCWPPRPDIDDVIFTVYEILTRDESSRANDEDDVSAIEALPHWPLHDSMTLESAHPEMATYRAHLTEWAHWRRTTRHIAHHADATHPISWPTHPPPPRAPSVVRYASPAAAAAAGEDPAPPTARQTRTEARRIGRYVVPWERPAQQRPCVPPPYLPEPGLSAREDGRWWLDMPSRLPRREGSPPEEEEEEVGERGSRCKHYRRLVDGKGGLMDSVM
ncbi:MAG: hypothetical protein M1817_004352 [Caeruleum heppii]|nr:MAG: hypothetical protein M1817_004352 [Caeruleum heppii]